MLQKSKKTCHSAKTDAQDTCPGTGPGIILCGLCALALVVLPGITEADSKLVLKINALTQSRHLRGSRYGVAVYDAAKNMYIVSIHRDRPLIPASNQKILVTSSALLELGPDFRFSTDMYASGRMTDGKLDGALYIRGGGDPTLSCRFSKGDVYYPVSAWVKSIQKAGIRSMTGPVLVDDSIFDRQFFHPSWSEKEAHKWYAAECGALSLNDNCIDLTIKPGRRGETARWSFVPYTAYISIRNKCRTVRGSKTRGIIINRKETEITIDGIIGEKAKRFFTNVPVHDPGLFTGAVLGRILAQNGIQAAYVARIDGSPDYSRMRKVCSFPSQTLSETIRVANARSQNFYAEMLLKYLGYLKQGKGTFANGRKAVEDILRENGIDMSNIIIDDGSGLSRKNRMSPHAMVDILLLMYRSGYKDTFMRSLAVPADPYGTLKKRLRGVKLKGTVHGKTGYINRVKALSGYAVRDDGNVLVFSFIVNNYNPKSGWHINKLQNTLMETLVNASY